MGEGEGEREREKTKPKPCKLCLEKWGQEPHAWGDSVLELDAYDKHVREHL